MTPFLKILKLLQARGWILTVGFFSSGRIRRKRVLFQEKGLSGESMEKEIANKMEKFPKCSAFNYR